jgi:hypothetical protein
MFRGNCFSIELEYLKLKELLMKNLLIMMVIMFSIMFAIKHDKKKQTELNIKIFKEQISVGTCFKDSNLDIEDLDFFHFVTEINSDHFKVTQMWRKSSDNKFHHLKSITYFENLKRKKYNTFKCPSDKKLYSKYAYRDIKKLL